MINNPLNFLDAESHCAASFGAHLVSFGNHSEQAEVEKYFTGLGGLQAAQSRGLAVRRQRCFELAGI